MNVRLVINANIDILKMKTLFQEGVKKIKTITVLIRKNSHPKYQTENLHPIIIIIVLLVLREENHLMDMLCKSLNIGYK